MEQLETIKHRNKQEKHRKNSELKIIYYDLTEVLALLVNANDLAYSGENIVHINAISSKITQEMHDIYHCIVFCRKKIKIINIFLNKRKTKQNNKRLKSQLRKRANSTTESRNVFRHFKMLNT